MKPISGAIKLADNVIDGVTGIFSGKKKRRSTGKKRSTAKKRKTTARKRK